MSDLKRTQIWSPAELAPGDVPNRTALTLITALGIAFGGYFVLRYLGLWSEQDTAVFVRIISEMREFASLRSPGAYTHGYAYPVWGAYLSGLMGVSVADLLQLYTPILGNVFLGIFGLAAFRRLLGSNQRGMIAASLLFLVPELVFTMSRGNHEKLTVSLTLLALVALLGSFQEMFVRGRWSVYAAWVVVLYSTIYTLTTLNILFGSSFIVASTLTLGFAYVVWLLRRRRNTAPASFTRGWGFRMVMLAPSDAAEGPRFAILIGRLLLVVSMCWLLVVMVTWYIYPQSGSNTALLDTVSTRLQGLFSAGGGGGETEAVGFETSNPYAAASTDWVGLTEYRVLTIYRWILFAGSFVAWLAMLRRAWLRLEQIPFSRLFLVALYGAFGVILAFTIPVDFLNLAAGTNLQVRMYTYFAVFATPMFGWGISTLLRRMTSVRLRRLVGVTAAALCTVFAVMSLMKASLDPLVSNRWLFYHPAEVQAVQFWIEHHTGASLWVDVEGRMRYGYTMTYPLESNQGNSIDVRDVRSLSSHALYSPVLANAAVAWNRPPPTYWLGNRAYDNGFATLYHRIPSTPFQR